MGKILYSGYFDCWILLYYQEYKYIYLKCNILIWHPLWMIARTDVWHDDWTIPPQDSYLPQKTSKYEINLDTTTEQKMYNS